MPMRFVDGEALWRSHKMLSVPSEFKAEYANLIPLAQANGAFECDARKIWSDVFSFNRPEVSVETIEKMLDAFEAAGMLVRYESAGKVYGYFPGIEKPGRLPSKAHQKRYKSLPPLPPFRDSPGQSGNMPEGFALHCTALEKAGTKEQVPVYAFEGKYIKLTIEEESRLATAFDWLDRQTEYRKADAWEGASKKRNHYQYIYRWLAREAKSTPKPKAKSDRDSEAAKRKAQSDEIKRLNGW